MTGSTTRIPPFTRALGVGGLVPFIVFSLALWLPLDFTQHTLAAGLLLTYAALILSFLGAIHWGLALRATPAEGEPDAVAMLWGVCPCLYAWLALMLPAPVGAGALAAGFIAQWLMDRARLQRLGAPGWLLRLRTGLSVVVVVTLAAAALAPHSP